VNKRKVYIIKPGQCIFLNGRLGAIKVEVIDDNRHGARARVETEMYEETKETDK
jgi:hypothetical protein